MKGRIWLESEPGQGTVFHFTAALGAPTEAPRADAHPLAGVSALVVDPSCSSGEDLRDVLLRWGMKPVLYDDAARALAAFEVANRGGVPFDVVLLDREHACAGSFELLDQIRGSNRLSRIVVVTSSCDGCRAGDCRDSGVDAFISKPFDETYLERVLLNLMAGGAVDRPIHDAFVAPARAVGGGQSGESESRRSGPREAGSSCEHRERRPGGCERAFRRHFRRGVDGRTDAGDERLGGHGGNSRARAGVRRARADHRDDGARDERRHCHLPGQRHGWLRVEAFSDRGADQGVGARAGNYGHRKI